MTTPQEVNKNFLRYAGQSLQADFDRIPVTNFTGVLDDYAPEEKEGFGGKMQINIALYFSQIQVHEQEPESDEYLSDTITIFIPHSNSKRSKYGIFVSSVNKALGIADEDHDLDLLMGKSWNLKLEPYNWGKIQGAQNADENGDVWSGVWRLYGISPSQPPWEVQAPVPQAPTTGAAAEISDQEILNLIDGKARTEYFPLLGAKLGTKELTNEKFQAIVSGSWLADQIAAGHLTEDAEQVFHKV